MPALAGTVEEEEDDEGVDNNNGVFSFSSPPVASPPPILLCSPSNTPSCSSNDPGIFPMIFSMREVKPSV